MIKTGSRIPFCSIKLEICSRTLSFMCLRFTVFWIRCCSNISVIIAVRPCNAKHYTTSSDFFLDKLEKFIFCGGLEIFASFVLFTNHMVTSIEPRVGIPMMIKSPSTMSATIHSPPRDCFIMYLSGECNLLERMVRCIFSSPQNIHRLRCTAA